MEQQEPLVNEAAVFFEGNELIVAFGPEGEEKTATLELANEQEMELVKTVLADVNMWANFLSSLSQAVKATV